jgi:hypothetical protein
MSWKRNFRIGHAGFFGKGIIAARKLGAQQTKIPHAWELVTSLVEQVENFHLQATVPAGCTKKPPGDTRRFS